MVVAGLVVPADDPQVESRWVQRPGGQRTREPRQAAEQPPDLSTNTRTHVRAPIHEHVRARDTYLRSIELHVRARAPLCTHTHAPGFFFLLFAGVYQ